MESFFLIERKFRCGVSVCSPESTGYRANPKKYRGGTGEIISPAYFCFQYPSGRGAGVDGDGVFDAEDVFEGFGGGQQAGLAPRGGDDLEAYG